MNFNTPLRADVIYGRSESRPICNKFPHRNGPDRRPADRDRRSVVARVPPVDRGVGQLCGRSGSPRHGLEDLGARAHAPGKKGNNLEGDSICEFR